MPPRVVDGEVAGDAETVEAADRADDTPPPITEDADEAARRLQEMGDAGGATPGA